MFETSTRVGHPKKLDDRIDASAQLNRVKEKIMQVWESRVRGSITSAPSKSEPVLRSQIPELLENLVSCISSRSSSVELNEAESIGKRHGEQRAGLQDYTFSQVLLEYRILRQVIFEILDAEKRQTKEVRDIILNVLDSGIEKTIDQFSHIRSEELKRSNRDLEHFAAIAAHDLKSPLATITGFAELLNESLDGKIGIEELEYLRTIGRSSARMTLLIDRLLGYSAIGAETKAFESVSTEKVVTNVMENLRTILASSRARIEFDQLPVIFGDPSLLSQLFQNFISNALKFRDHRRVLEIEIIAKIEGQDWLFSIRDNGTGFDPKDRENIFSLFKRLDSAKARKGSGIGLATARKVVELHGGRVWAESRPGVGSTFFFTLPKFESPHLVR